MEIKIKHSNNKDFYDKFLFVLSNIEKIENKKCKKITKITSEYLRNIILSIISTIVFTILYLIIKNIIYLCFVAVFIMLFLLLLIIYSNLNKRINIFINDQKESILVINEDGIELKKETQNIKLTWESISYIIDVNDLICFIPKNKNEIAIGVDGTYKNKILEGIKKYNKLDLVIKI